MENEGNKIVPFIGYVIAVLIPIIGLVYGTMLFYLKRMFHYTAITADT